MIWRRQCLSVGPERAEWGRREVARRLRVAAGMKGERLGEGRTWVEPDPPTHPGAVVYVHAEAPLFCRCPTACTELATDPATERCERCVPAEHGVGCAHTGPPGTPPGTPMRPLGTVLGFGTITL